MSSGGERGIDILPLTAPTSGIINMKLELSEYRAQTNNCSFISSLKILVP